MKTILKSALILSILFIASCSSKPSLQEYIVTNKENSNFIAADVPVSILNIDQIALSAKQKEALSSLKKLNVLAFKKTSENATDYQLEKSKVKEILNNEDFIELIKMNSSYGKAVVKYIGDDDAIDEVIVYGDNDEKGFALVRILGDNMNPANIIQLIQALEKSDFEGKGLKDIGALFEN